MFGKINSTFEVPEPNLLQNQAKGNKHIGIL